MNRSTCARLVPVTVIVVGIVLAPATAVAEGTLDTATNDTLNDTSYTVTPTPTGDTTLNATVTPSVDDTSDTVDDTSDSIDITVDSTADTVDDTTSETMDGLTGTTEYLLESDVTAVGMVSSGSTDLLTAETTAELLGESNTTSVGMAGDGGSGSAESAAQFQPDGESGTPLPDVPPEGAVAGALGLAAVGAVLVKQGALTAGSTASTGAATGRGLLGRLTRLFAPFRYSRFDDSDPLEHEARVEMLDAVEAAPGTYLSEIAEQADLPLSTVRHHVRVLEREGLVASAKVRGRRRFYPGGTEGLELAAAMNDEATATVLDALARLGPSSVSGLAEAVDRDPSTVTHHLKRLEEDGIVVRERDGRAMVNRLSPEAAEVLEPELETEEEAVDAAASAD